MTLGRKTTEASTRRRVLARCVVAALLLLGSLLLTACDHVGIPERPRTAYALEFEGMWDAPRRGSRHVEVDGYGPIGTLVIEDSCVLIIEDVSHERIIVLLPQLLPRYRPAVPFQTDEGMRLRSKYSRREYAIAWLPTLFDEESQSLWVGTSERITTDGQVSLGNSSSEEHVKKCDADRSFRADHIERWPY